MRITGQTGWQVPRTPSARWRMGTAVLDRLTPSRHGCPTQHEGEPCEGHLDLANSERPRHRDRMAFRPRGGDGPPRSWARLRRGAVDERDSEVRRADGHP